MQKNSLTIGRIFGIPIRIHNSWFLLFILISWSLASQYLPQRYTSWTITQYWLVAVATSLLLFASVLLHELAHALVALSRGIPVHDIVLFIFGGVAELTEEPEDPRSEFTMAVAGPLTSFVLAFLFLIAWFVSLKYNPFIAALSIYLAGTNASLGAFNLIPGFPLDGGRVLRSVLWAVTGDINRATRWATGMGQAVAYLFITIGVLQVIQRRWIDGIWLAFIGWFLENAAQTSYRQIVLRQFLMGHQVRQAMTGQCYPLAPNMTLDTLVRDYIVPLGFGCFPVVSEGTTQGIVSLPLVRKVPEASWPQVTVRAVMFPLDRVESLSPGDNLWKAMTKMSAGKMEQLPVTEHGQFLGILTHDDILAFIQRNSRIRI